MNDVIAVVVLTLALALPLGWYMARVFMGLPNPLDSLAPLERWLYRSLGINPQQSMDWRVYASALLGSNLLVALVAYGVLVLQGVLPLNPDGVPSMSWDLALHTVASFITNTNQQHYSGQAQLSYLSQMVVVTALQFISPAAGLAMLVAILRALRGHNFVGNYYVDLTQAITRVLLPLSVVLALLLGWQGVPSTFGPGQTVLLLQPQTAASSDASKPTNQQVIPLGPVAAMVAIKQLGTNGGGWYGPNSSVPLENPTPLSNVLQMVAILLLPVAQVVMLGFLLGNLRFAAMVFAVMTTFSLIFTTAILAFENQPNPALLGIGANAANYEGKEWRFGLDSSALWATLTTQTSNGSVNAMHDSLNPLSGLVTLIDMFINATWGGVGVGAINFLLYVVLSVFIAGLMVGRTPEWLGRKLEAREIKLASLALLLQPLLILVPTALTLALGVANNSNPGFHGISQVLYEYTSAFANNGSGFEGLGDNTVWWNTTTAVVLILARYIPMIAPLAIAAFLASKRSAPSTGGTLRTDSAVFGLMVFSIIVVVQLLNFVPVLVLGPIAEHLVGIQ